MTLALAVLLVAVLISRELQARRHEARIDRLLHATGTERHEAQAARDRMLEILRAPNPDTVEFIALTERLCQRLQAPEQAVVEHQMSLPVPEQPQAVLPDDDLGWFAAQQGMSKDALAEALMKAENDARAAA